MIDYIIWCRRAKPLGETFWSFPDQRWYSTTSILSAIRGSATTVRQNHLCR